MLTYQDYEAATDKLDFVQKLISEHKSSNLVQTALTANEYDRQRNTTINKFIQRIYTMKGQAVENKFASNNKRASNFFRILNRQRCMFLLGNGVTLEEETKKKLGIDFDTQMQRAGYRALIHGISFVFFNMDKVHVFPVTEFAPMWDEESGILRAGVRYWQLDSTKPLMVTLYEPDGYTTYSKGKKDKKFVLVKDKLTYKRTTVKAPIDDVPEVIGEENYDGVLPIVPFWGSELKQSTLIGMREGIDSYDLISNGLCNDLRDCARVFMLIENFGGMDDEALTEFRDRLVTQHMASVDTQTGGKITPYTQEIPFAAVEAYLNRLKQDIYSDFGALNVVDISAAQKTATEIDAAYQPLDDAADDFEYQMIAGIQKLLKLIGSDETPTFKRNKVSNQLEQAQLLDLEAGMVPLDPETLLSKFPNFTPEEVQEALDRMIDAQADRVNNTPVLPKEEEPQDGGVNA